MITHLRHVLRAGPPAVGRQSEVDANVLSLVTDGGIGADQIVRVEPTVIQSPSGSGELVLHGAELDCFVVLQVMSEGGGPSQPAIVTFRGCLQSVFGYPNDEAQSGDPRFHHGGYGFFEAT